MELASFSKSRAQGDTYDKSQLKRYFRPSMPFDLSEGFDTFRDRDRNNPRPANLEPIFESLREAGVDERVLASADVISWRGNLSKILATPWNTRDAWHMEAELVHGVVVLNVLEPAENLAREANRQGRDALMCYWGFSFEEACTGGTYDEPIDCMNAYCAVVRAGVGRHRLILGGEVDCWDGQTEGLGGYVELKTTRIMETASQVARFERDKLLKWWAQSFAVGVRRIIVGFRDDDGAVRKLQTLETLKLPGYAARHPGRGTPRPRSSSRISSSPGSARTSVRFPRDRACAWSTNREDVNTRFARRWIPTRPISYPRERENNSRGRRRFAPREAPPAAAAAEAEATAEAPAASDPWGVANVVEEASAEAEAEAEAGRRRRRSDARTNPARRAEPDPDPSPWCSRNPNLARRRLAGPDLRRARRLPRRKLPAAGPEPGPIPSLPPRLRRSTLKIESRTIRRPTPRPRRWWSVSCTGTGTRVRARPIVVAGDATSEVRRPCPVRDRANAPSFANFTIPSSEGPGSAIRSRWRRISWRTRAR